VLTQYFGDLFIAATMIFWAGYQKTFGAMSGDPQQAMTWEENYQNIKKGAAIEEARKKFQGPGWTGYAPTPTATPPRE
jgi:hypothetical protein